MSCPSSIVAYKTHGMSTQFLRFLLSNHWVIGEQYRDTLQTYKLECWDASLFLQEMKNGMIQNYHVIFKNTSRGRILLETQQHTQHDSSYAPKVYLSFRAALPEFNLDPIVLVSLQSYTPSCERNPE